YPNDSTRARPRSAASANGRPAYATRTEAKRLGRTSPSRNHARRLSADPRRVGATHRREPVLAPVGCTHPTITPAKRILTRERPSRRVSPASGRDLSRMGPESMTTEYTEHTEKPGDRDCIP